MSRAVAGAFSIHDIPGAALRLRASKANGGGMSDGTAALWIPDEVSGNTCRLSGGSPVLNASSTLNGKPGITFTGADSDVMTGVMRHHGQITFIYGVASYTAATPFSGNKGMFTRNSVGPADIGITGANTTTTVFESYGNAWINGVDTNVIADPTAINIFIITDVVPSDVWTGGYAIGSYGSAASFWTGDIVEVGAVCTTVPTASDIALLTASLAAEYGVILP